VVSPDPDRDDNERLPQGASRYYAGLAESQDPAVDPIAAQFVPRPAEADVLPWESSDPLDERRFAVAPRLIHRYTDRVLLLANDRCAVYCRHCFRRHFTGHGGGRIRDDELDAVCRYIAAHPGVHEVLVSGGDPLMLSDAELATILERLLAVRPDLLLRICTRVPVVLPSRVTAELAALLGRSGTTWLVTHVNHPREMTPELTAAVRRLLAEGVPVLNQAVLLRGINDSVETLEALFRGLLRVRIKPYYLFQGDLASGTAHFRVPMERGLALVRELRGRLSGLAMPVYAVDLPGGGGKVPIESALLRFEADACVLRGPDGREYRYPREA
jgi:lysine 2,3-aminomutase